MIRYSLRDVFCLLTLAPISAGVVYVAEFFSGEVLDYFNTIDNIVSATGWPLYSMHTLFFIMFSTISSTFYGNLIALAMLSLLFLRNRWATLLALSMPFGILCLLCLRFWTIAAPVNSEIVLLVAKWSILPVLVAICLLFLGWWFVNRLPTHKLGEKTTFIQRPPWQGYFLTAAFVIYISVSAYGWYGMVSFRNEMIEMWRHLEQSGYLQNVR